MRDSADTAGMPDVRSRRSFFGGEIVCQDHPLEMKVEFALNFSRSEMHVVRAHFTPLRSGVFFSAISRLFFCGAFRDPNSDSRNECVLRPRGRHAKSSRQKHRILMQLF